MSPADDSIPENIDTGTLTRLLRDHPIRVGILSGSHVHGTETSESDVDLAVEFDESLSREERHQARLDVIVDVMETLAVDDVDVTDLDAVRPAIGASALRTGIVLVGDDERVEQLREDFESRVSRRSHEERMREFDDLLERLEASV